MKCLPALLLCMLAVPPAGQAQNDIRDLAQPATPQPSPLPAPQSAPDAAQDGGMQAPHSAQAVEQEISGYEQDCRANYMLSSLHDCACLSAGYRSEVVRTGSFNRAGAGKLLLATCPAPRSSIYDWANQSCTDYVQHVRSDWEGFCACASNNFADAYLAKPLGQLREIEALRNKSYEACGLGERSHNS